MKQIIDQAGKLFGIINIIDAMALILICIVIPFTYTRYITPYLKDQKSYNRKIIVEEISCKAIELSNSLAEIIKVGDVFYDDKGAELARIIALDKIEPYSHLISLSTSKMMLFRDPVLKQRNLKVKANLEVIGKKLYYNRQIIEIGQGVDFQAKNYSIRVLLFSDQLDERWIKVKICFLNNDRSRNITINAGDKHSYEGRVIAKIASIVSQNNSHSSLRNLKNKDVTAIVDMLVAPLGDNFYFNNSLLKVNSQVVLDFSGSSALGTILEILPDNH